MDKPLEDRLGDAEAAVVDLRARIDELTRQLRDARDRVELSMRAELRCPGCGGRKLLHVTKIPDLPLETPVSLTGEPGMFGVKTAGRFEVFVCTACARVEWYVADLAEVKVDGRIVRLIDGEKTPEGPYR